MRKSFRGVSLFCCLLFLSSCSDFASIFKGNSSRSAKSSKKDQGKKIAGTKTRNGKGKVVQGVFVWPLSGGEVSSGFGQRDGRPHDGIDIRAPKGTPVTASAAGEVVYAGKMSGYGNLVVLQHDQDYFTAYAHNDEIEVGNGKKVKKGDLIAKVGDTGHATGYHLHFEIRQGSTPMDPLLFLP